MEILDRDAIGGWLEGLGEVCEFTHITFDKGDRRKKKKLERECLALGEETAEKTTSTKNLPKNHDQKLKTRSYQNLLKMTINIK